MECLNEVLERLTEAGIPAGAAFPEGEQGCLTTAAAAVSLGSVDQENGRAEVLVRILSPRKLGAWHCQQTGIQAMETLSAGGFCCRMEAVTYETGCDCFQVILHAQGIGLVESRWQSEKLMYKGWAWPRNPDRFLIEAVREPEYNKSSSGAVTYKGLGALCRTITGSGVFSGNGAAAQFKSLAAFLDSDAAGTLVHPVWGSFNACLMELKMEPESREDWIAYSFVFRETDAKGSIPALSTGNNWVIYDM